MPLTAVLAAASLLLLLVTAALTAALTAVLRISDPEARILAGEGFAGADALAALLSDEVATSPVGMLRAICFLGATASGVAAAATAWGTRGCGSEARPWSFWCSSRETWLPVRSRAAARFAWRWSPRPSSAGLPASWAGCCFRCSQWDACSRGCPAAATLRRMSCRSREALEIGAGEGVVGADEHRLVERAFKLDELNAWTP